MVEDARALPAPSKAQVDVADDSPALADLSGSGEVEEIEVGWPPVSASPTAPSASETGSQGSNGGLMSLLQDDAGLNVAADLPEARGLIALSPVGDGPPEGPAFPRPAVTAILDGAALPLAPASHGRELAPVPTAAEGVTAETGPLRLFPALSTPATPTGMPRVPSSGPHASVWPSQAPSTATALMPVRAAGIILATPPTEGPAASNSTPAVTTGQSPRGAADLPIFFSSARSDAPAVPLLAALHRAPEPWVQLHPSPAPALPEAPQVVPSLTSLSAAEGSGVLPGDRSPLPTLTHANLALRTAESNPLDGTLSQRRDGVDRLAGAEHTFNSQMPAGPITPPGQSPGAGPGPSQLAAQAASQIASALSGPAMAQGAELVLTPPELGRVSIRFESERAGGVLILLIDRPETLDLMRRHLDTLDEALRLAGHDGCSVALGGRGGDRPIPFASPDPPNEVDAETSGRRDEPFGRTSVSASGRLDLRL
jgi:hypothetical protein